MLPIERKNIEPMAPWLSAGNARLTHQSLHHIVCAILEGLRGTCEFSHSVPGLEYTLCNIHNHVQIFYPRHQDSFIERGVW